MKGKFIFTFLFLFLVNILFVYSSSTYSESFYGCLNNTFSTQEAYPPFTFNLTCQHQWYMRNVFSIGSPVFYFSNLSTSVEIARSVDSGTNHFFGIDTDYDAGLDDMRRLDFNISMYLSNYTADTNVTWYLALQDTQCGVSANDIIRIVLHDAEGYFKSTNCTIENLANKSLSNSTYEWYTFNYNDIMRECYEYPDLTTFDLKSVCFSSTNVDVGIKSGIRLNHFDLDFEGDLNVLPNFWEVQLTSDSCINETNPYNQIIFDLNIDVEDYENDDILYSLQDTSIANYTKLYTFTKYVSVPFNTFSVPDYAMYDFLKYTPDFLNQGEWLVTLPDYWYLSNSTYYYPIKNTTYGDANNNLYLNPDMQGINWVYQFEFKDLTDEDKIILQDYNAYGDSNLCIYGTVYQNSSLRLFNCYNDSQIVNLSYNPNDDIKVSIKDVGNTEYYIYLQNFTNFAYGTVDEIYTSHYPYIRLAWNETSKYLFKSFEYSYDLYDGITWSSDYPSTWTENQDSNWFQYSIFITDNVHVNKSYITVSKQVNIPVCDEYISLDVNALHFVDENDVNPFAIINNLLKVPFTNYLVQLNVWDISDLVLGIIMFIVFILLVIITRSIGTSFMLVGLSGSILTYIGSMTGFVSYLILFAFGLAIIIVSGNK